MDMGAMQMTPAAKPAEASADTETTAAQMDHSKMDHSKMDHSKMDHSAMDHSQMDHAAMSHAPAAPMAPREPIPPVTDADRAAAFPPIDHGAMQHAPAINSLVLIDRLEQWDGNDAKGQAWEATGWVGGDINRLWLRSSGERSGGRTEASNLEAMYGRAVSPWWDVLVGVRQDFRPGDSRTWAAVGLQGLAPYKFQSQAALYAGSGGQLMAKAEMEYDVLLTNRLILQPLLGAAVAARDEPQRGIGRGLNSVEAGLRLRYEFSRRFAP
ncbi:MAG: Copper resistance protein B [Stenotrophomonas maltophilia]|uniref:Copper resistance protein B n=1 Tax=Stenotrophomonas maltophilia TaxID=40324 RepID=A0A7V8FK81_STEMA|nr:MAG: Copper resistance protein B [Stenotrophomonas maltophilia]